MKLTQSAAILCLTFASVAASAEEGQVVEATLHSPALSGNLLQDSPDRHVVVYLPPSYESEVERRYPVVYLLHGYGAHSTDWISGAQSVGGTSILPGFERFMLANPEREMILVMPDHNNRYGHSYYANSAVTGNWMDFMVNDLVRHIDSTYRTLPQPDHRGVAGHSAGGMSALRLAIGHPGTFSAVYGLSSASPSIDPEFYLGFIKPDNALEIIAGEAEPPVWLMSMWAAFLPNPDNPPLLIDLPFEVIDGRLRVVESVWQRWRSQLPIGMIASHGDELRSLRGVAFDVESQGVHLQENREFSRALTELGIPHVFETHDGDHTSRLAERIETRMLPFFADVLFDALPPASTVIERTSWGWVKAEAREMKGRTEP